MPWQTIGPRYDIQMGENRDSVQWQFLDQLIEVMQVAYTLYNGDHSRNCSGLAPSVITPGIPGWNVPLSGTCWATKFRPGVPRALWFLYLGYFLQYRPPYNIYIAISVAGDGNGLGGRPRPARVHPAQYTLC